MGWTSVSTLNRMAASISFLSVNVPLTVYGFFRKSSAAQRFQGISGILLFRIDIMPCAKLKGERLFVVPA